MKPEFLKREYRAAERIEAMSEPTNLPVYNRSRFVFVIKGFGVSLWSKPFALIIYWRSNKHVWASKAVVGHLAEGE